jgi:hypothetical protein
MDEEAPKIPMDEEAPEIQMDEEAPEIQMDEEAPTLELSQQKGGNVSDTDKIDFANQFTDIPFYLYKLLPKIINNEVTVNNRKRKTIDLAYIDDNKLTTIYANDRICLYTKEDALKYSAEQYNGLNSLPKDFVIWLNDGRLSVEKNTLPKFIFNDKDTSTLVEFDTTGIIAVIHDKGYFTRSTANNLITTLTDDGSEFLSTLIGEENDPADLAGGTLEENSSIPLLDTYYDLFFTKDISLDPKTLENNNFLSLVSYFNIFSYYESCLCCDNEEYYQSFNNDNNVEVTNKLNMYLMFKQLLDDFTDKKDKICYGLLEYFLNSGDTKQNYFAISDDLETVIYYVFSNYKILGTSSNIRINDMINKNQIDINNPIFINTLQYFQELYPKILQKTTEIEDFLTGVNTDTSNLTYIKKYLSIYGFMNMANDYQDTISPQMPIDVEEKSDNVVAKGLSQYDLVKQKRRREQDEAHSEQVAKIKKGVLKSKTGMSTDEQQYLTIKPSMFNTTSLYARGGISKKHRKKRVTRRAKKTKNNKKKTIKNKKRKQKTRR